MSHSLESKSTSLAGGNGSYEASVHANGEWTRKILALDLVSTALGSQAVQKVCASKRNLLRQKLKNF